MQLQRSPSRLTSFQSPTGFQYKMRNLPSIQSSSLRMPSTDTRFFIRSIHPAKFFLSLSTNLEVIHLHPGMAVSSIRVACVLGLLLLNTAPIVIQPNSYIVRYRGDARCNSGQGELVFSGSDSPIALTSTGNLQVQTTTVSSERPQDIWNQNLITEDPERYQIRQDDGESQNCMFVDADVGAGSIVTTDVCASTSTTFQQFQYNLVQSAPGCDSSNENGYAVQIRPAAVVDIGGDLCFSASSSSGVTVTVEPCNSADESQLFFVNVPAIITGA